MAQGTALVRELEEGQGFFLEYNIWGGASGPTRGKKAVVAQDAGVADNTVEGIYVSYVKTTEGEMYLFGYDYLVELNNE